MARIARADCANALLQSLLETVKLMEVESSNLLRAIEEHRRDDHA